jgi:uncharacterized protein (DUF486 family)
VEWWEAFVKFLADPNAQVLLTVAGLGVFLKVLLVPAVKMFAEYVYPKKALSGLSTVIVVHICALLTVIVATKATHQVVALGPLLLVAWAATKDALGLQQQTTALLRSKKL